MRHATFSVVILALCWTTTAGALTPNCNPCVGLRTDDPLATARVLEKPGADEPDRVIFVAWQQPLDGSLTSEPLVGLEAKQLTPWISLVFQTPAPVIEHLGELARELEEAARISRLTHGAPVVQVLWLPAADAAVPPSADDAAFLFKRAAVAIAGANADAMVATMPLPHDSNWLRAFYADDMVAYVDLIAVEPAASSVLSTTVDVLSELDAGRPVAVDTMQRPSIAPELLSAAARNASLGARISLFNGDHDDLEAVQALSLLAREFSDDLAFDPYMKISGVDEAWAFVRGEDLAVRAVVRVSPTPGAETTEIIFGDRQLSSPTRIRLDGSEQSVYGRRVEDGLLTPVADPDPVMVIRLERLAAAELGGFENRVEVDANRQMPVEEILERLQAFEDAQSRRIRHYEARKMMHLRYTSGEGVGSIEVSFEGNFFFRRDSGFDWAWQDLFVNGVRWRGRLPKLPIIQPEAAATLPFEINFTKEYNYRLRGTDTVDGRSCWVVEFEPAGNGDEGNLYQGSVWVDRELYCRVKTRAIQLGLEGDVISNEETVFVTPVDAQGQAAAWDRESFFLPTRTVGQEIQSILNAAFPVERETVLEDVRVNASGFDERLDLAHQSEVTMVRDTAEGMRYLVKDGDGNRQVEPEVDFDSLALVGGAFYDENQDYPLPLAGVNYFSRDFRGSGQQLNLFFAGILVNANYADPNLFGSRWDAGGRLFGFFVPGEEVLYRGGEEMTSEAVERSNARAAFYLGRPLGSFTKLSFTYGLGYERFGRADDTAEEFVIPEDTLTNSLGAELAFTRAGYNLSMEATSFSRSDWSFWGMPGNQEYDPEQKDYLQWKVTAAKAWWLSSFMKLAVSLEHLNGENLDRFSKYDFSTFADSSVGGYQSGLVTASEASGIHLSYGFNMADALRVEVQGDAVWATDEATDLKNEFLAGISLNGTVMGPWQTVINFDIGVPVQGPADSFTARIAFLKLFN